MPTSLQLYGNLTRDYSLVKDGILDGTATDASIAQYIRRANIRFTGNTFDDGATWGPIMNQTIQEVILLARQYRRLTEQFDGVPSLEHPAEELRGKIHNTLAGVLQKHYYPSVEENIKTEEGLQPDEDAIKKHAYTKPFANALMEHYGVRLPERQDEIRPPDHQEIQDLLAEGIDLEDRVAA